MISSSAPIETLSLHHRPAYPSDVRVPVSVIRLKSKQDRNGISGSNLLARRSVVAVSTWLCAALTKLGLVSILTDGFHDRIL